MNWRRFITTPPSKPAGGEFKLGKNEETKELTKT
jgi:hypothetical protein